MIRMPDLSRLTELESEHDVWRVQQRGIPPDWFMYEIGNYQTILPEHGLGHPVHQPCCTPGRPDGCGFGWRPCDVMLVLPYVSDNDVVTRSCMLSNPGVFLRKELTQLGIDLEQCVATHAVRFALPPGMTTYKSQHKETNRPYVQADVWACNPKVVITFGADALKALFGRNAKLDTYRGAVHEWNGIPVIPTVAPATFSKSLGGVDVFRSELYRAVKVMMGTHAASPGWKPGYRWCKTVDDMAAVAREIIEGGYTKLAIDTEFGNDTSREEDSYLLSFQVCWKPGHAAFFPLRGERGGGVAADYLARAHDIILAIVKRPGVKLFGQHLRVDVDVPKRNGLNWEELLETGFDTMLANHLLRGGGGDEGQGLDHLTRRYCPELGAYWKPVEDWLDANGRSKHLRFGYRNVPFDLLSLYGCQDVDVTLTAGLALESELELNPKQKALFEHLVMPCSLAILDIQEQGILLDTPRVKELHDIYAPAFQDLLKELRKAINWPNFNPGSNQQKATLLFSNTTYRDKKPAPEGALVLAIDPLFNTDKFPGEWAAIAAAGEERYHSPSCKAATIDLLWQAYRVRPNEEHATKVLKLLKQLSVLGKFLTTYLAEAETNELGVKEGGKNLGNNIWRDGRVRGKIQQTSETGRWRMGAANLQTNPKKQEEAAFEIFVDRRFGATMTDYRERCSDAWRDASDWIRPEQRIENTIPTFKSCYISPKGSSIIEVDFKTAELAGLAYGSGDETLIKIIEQNRDLHAETAAKAFKLPALASLPAVLAELELGNKKPYSEWKEALKEAYGGLRVAAKTVTFGICYGRGANALTREICKTGVDIEVEGCQKLIDGFAAAYPKAWAWIQSNMDSAIDNGYVETAFGRRRYFHGIASMGGTEQAAARREAANSPLQGLVADLLAMASINLYRFRYRSDEGRAIGYKVLLPIHDAFWIEVRNEHVDRMKEIIVACLSTWNKIPGTDKSLGVDIEVFPYRVGDKHPSEDDRPDFADPEWDAEYKRDLDRVETA